LPDFEVYLDFTTSYGEFGYTVYGRKPNNNSTWIDGVFSYNIHYKGKLVMCLSFCVSRYGLLINSVQLTHNKGNRWLYKIPGDYVEFFIHRMAAAFQGWPIHFVNGKSLVKRTVRNYRDHEHLFTPEMRKHVIKVYSRKLR